MEAYEKPKIKLKNRKKSAVSMKQPADDKTTVGGGKKSDLGASDIAKIPMNKRMRLKKKKSGKTTYVRTSTSKPNIMDARMMTGEAAKEGMEKQRIKRERGIYETLLRLK